MKRTSLQTTLGILLILAVLVLVNLIANTAFVRLDLTEDQIFSLSSASKAAVKDLQEPLTIKVFASENLSPQLNDIKRYLNDLLSDYRSYGKGNFHYEFIDPANSDELEAEAQSYRIPPFQENVWNKDKLELKRVYLGMVMLYEDKQEVIPTIQSTSGLEYEITSRIKRMAGAQERTVAFLSGHGEPDYTQEMQQLNTLLQRNYKVRSIDLSREPLDPSLVDVLLIVQPTTDLPDSQKVLIDQYLMNGGRMGLFFSPVETDLQRGFARDRGFNLGPWTSKYGFSINGNLVMDQNCNMINVQERRGFFTIQNTVSYVFFPNITRFAKDNPITGDLDLVSLFYPSELKTQYKLEGDAVPTLTPLMRTSAETKIQPSPRYNISVDNQWPKSQFNDSSRVVAATLTGPFPSAFANGKLPEGYPTATADLIASSPEDARIVVVTEGNFLRDAFMTTPANLFFVLNSVDWLVGDTDLIALRSREVAMRPLADISDGAKAGWKYVNWFLPPIIAIIAGLIYWQIRRRRYNQREGA